jgi:hypothetical protein
VAVATAGSGAPGGCEEAKRTVTVDSDPTKVRVTRDLAACHRELASGLEGAAARRPDRR